MSYHVILLQLKFYIGISLFKRGKEKFSFAVFCLFKELLGIPGSFGDDVNLEGMQAGRD